MRLGLKTISLNTVIHDYDQIIQNTFFHLDESTIIEEHLKQINTNDINFLMGLGNSGLFFISSAIRNNFDEYELTPEQEWEVYCLANGFGNLSSNELKEINDGWDWSHIRDSDNESIMKIEYKIKGYFLEIYNKK